MFTLSVHAQSSAGVSQGNSFKYDFSAHFSAANATETVPPQLIEDNATQWLRLTVTSVSNTTVNYVMLQHFKNGTEVSTSDQTDVATGSGGFIIVGANLALYDPLFPTVASPAIVNETITRTYSSGQRQINHASWNETDYSAYLDLYFDQKTGLPVEFHLIFQASPDGYAEYRYTIVDSNVWLVPEFPMLPFIAALAAAVTVAVVVCRKRFSPSSAEKLS
jgi:hypothetical protein